MLEALEASDVQSSGRKDQTKLVLNVGYNRVRYVLTIRGTVGNTFYDATTGLRVHCSGNKCSVSIFPASLVRLRLSGRWPW